MWVSKREVMGRFERKVEEKSEVGARAGVNGVSELT